MLNLTLHRLQTKLTKNLNPFCFVINLQHTSGDLLENHYEWPSKEQLADEEEEETEKEDNEEEKGQEEVTLADEIKIDLLAQENANSDISAEHHTDVTPSCNRTDAPPASPPHTLVVPGKRPENVPTLSPASTPQPISHPPPNTPMSAEVTVVKGPKSPSRSTGSRSTTSSRSVYIPEYLGKVREGEGG